MRGRLVLYAALLAAPALGLAAADGSWLRKVPAADRQRANPFAGQAAAADAGAILFRNNCAKCHGNDAQGKGNRPSLRSERLQGATDGEIAWLLKNGNAFRGMPGWGALPEAQRWQLVAYVRRLNTAMDTLTAAQPETKH